MSIEAGSKLKGKVSGITNFGAFVDLPDGKTGLVHISEVADRYVKDIHDVLSIGDEVTVKVLQVAPDGKIGLSIRKAVDKPRNAPRNSRGGGKRFTKETSFEDKISHYLKESEDRLSTIRRQTESKRGGRGARRG
ncbi:MULTISPECIES: S1 domain-containing RNA-binding protein [unclassified Sporolactobacillus]|uniref:S1 domain-containing RNA-binding protein n=1 Tax=unclassified Sporolactobacillus TaxID=2628533 RepID=UPI002368B9D2|nr:S1 domain-containing RNA-binding protein [Sporolactobacillus sp. CQH2019]MDD9150703.1 S1 domain-containing RNA-binding protein [Sporolactobacillus sp. CQH2019]